MTFDSYKAVIEENDTVILYISFNTMYALQVIDIFIDTFLQNFKWFYGLQHLYPTLYLDSSIMQKITWFTPIPALGNKDFYHRKTSCIFANVMKEMEKLNAT